MCGAGVAGFGEDILADRNVRERGGNGGDSRDRGRDVTRRDGAGLVFVSALSMFRQLRHG
jgi:hypothetical protein